MNRNVHFVHHGGQVWTYTALGCVAEPFLGAFLKVVAKGRGESGRGAPAGRAGPPGTLLTSVFPFVFFSQDERVAR